MYPQHIFLVIGISLSLSFCSSFEILEPRNEKTVLVDAEGTTFKIAPDVRKEVDHFLIAIFDQVTVVVEAPDFDFPWHGIKGVSTDDLHRHTEALVYNAFGETSANQLEFDPKKSQGLVRDVLSSCPSPLFSTNRRKCTLTFSPYGTSFVSIFPKSRVTVSIFSERKFNPTFLVVLASGILLFLLAHQLSKSKIFQYLAGSIVFIVAGFVVVVLYLMDAFSEKKKGNVVRTTSLGTIISFYGASVVYFVRTHLRQLILHHWELVLGYIVVAALLGLIFVGLIRRHESSKHSMRVCVKWIIRLVGSALVYNSSASPFVSASLVGISAVVYILLALVKNISQKLIGTKDKKKV